MILGDSQLRFLTRDRSCLVTDAEVCIFSYDGATTTTSPVLIDRLQLEPVDFTVLYVGGNDISKGASALETYVRLQVSHFSFRPLTVSYLLAHS